MRQEIWQERADRLSTYFKAGLTFAEIAARAGVHQKTVASYAKVLGGTQPKLGGKMAQRVAAIRELALAGNSRQEVAIKLGLAYQNVAKMATAHSIPFVHGGAKKAGSEPRAEAMAAMFMSGKTLAEIGALYDLTRERVRQIITKHHGMTRENGGQAVRAERRRDAAELRREAKSLKKNGCTFAEYRELVELGANLMAEGATRERTPVGAWNSQRSNARARGVEWSLKIWDWWQLWQQSGKWDVRGRQKGQYVMCRFGDVGAYEVGNVYIATCSHNCSHQPNNPRRNSKSPKKKRDAAEREIA